LRGTLHPGFLGHMALNLAAAVVPPSEDGKVA
jgi:hypothetical protein